MKHRPLVVRVCAFAATLSLSAGSLLAQPTIYSDTVGDIAAGIATAGGTLDIIKMEVSDTTTDIIFNLTVNGITTPPNDWGNFMIGIANMKDPGATNTTGNGWGRPIRLLGGATNAMTHWIGSWVNGGGGAQLWAYNGTWTNTGGLPAYTFATNTNGTSTISYTVSKASLGTTNLGDIIRFDAYSSGGGGTDSAVDSLANPNIAITGWSGPYTSGGTNPIAQYTTANSASFITNTVTFAVDMNVQQSINNFFPDFDAVTVAGAWNGFIAGDTNYVLTDPDTNGIYTGTFAIPGVYGTSVPYKFAINTTLETIPNRTFPVGTNATPPPLILPTVFYNDNPGFRNVTFSVDMSVQEALGNYNGTNDVLVVGAFNNWDTSGGSGNVLVGSNGVFTGTISNIGGAPGANVPYKFYSAGMPNSGYESISDRQLTLGPVGSNQIVPTAFWNNVTNVPASRPVSFSVDMTVQVANGNFNTNSGVVRVIGNFNGQNYETGNTNYNLTNAGSNIYVGEFAITGDAGTTNQYKFYSPGFPVNNGFEVVNPNDLFENRTWVLGPSNVLQTLPLVFWSNDNGGATFTSWAQGAPLNTTNLSLYAVGGASGPTNNNSIPSVTTLTTNLLSITAIVRTNNPSLSVIGRTTTNLATGPWTTNTVTQSNAVDQSGVPFGTARQIFSTPRTSTNQFLGIEAVLQP